MNPLKTDPMSNFIQTIFTPSKKLNTDQLVFKKTFIAFFFFFLFMGAAVYGWILLRRQKESANDTRPLVRKVLNTNESIFRQVFSGKHMAKTYPVSDAVPSPRVNGYEGLKSKLDSAGWRLLVVRSNGDTLRITLDDLKKLPRTDLVFNFKCIEGWSQVTHWAGVKFRDFVDAYHLTGETQMKYLGLTTPDNQYYVGIDMPSALHPQTILCYDMNDRPLPLNQGYPLRLIIPVKYGIKNLKRIGTMIFSNTRPRDYWYERGYDYYSGL
jgi:DMSO/TMAO reductase YedYZ molybdopterin-dependent catalytic subunit